MGDPAPLRDPPAVLQAGRQTDRRTGRVAALLWSNSSPGKQAGCLPACKCERGKGAIFKEELRLSQTAEKGSCGPHHQPPRHTGPHQGFIDHAAIINIS